MILIKIREYDLIQFNYFDFNSNNRRASSHVQNPSDFFHEQTKSTWSFLIRRYETDGPDTSVGPFFENLSR